MEENTSPSQYCQQSCPLTTSIEGNKAEEIFLEVSNVEFGDHMPLPVTLGPQKTVKDTASCSGTGSSTVRVIPNQFSKSLDATDSELDETWCESSARGL